ncbi:Pentatricopeptide repeat-containing protein [Spatholobus suberectus]|nr:Pentatricopeptide repeat-containing protein [Spatholobus suberectus]
MEQTRKLVKGVLKNTKNPKLAWHLVKRVLSSPSPSSSSSTLTHTPHLVAITTRILAGANMHRELDDLHKLLLASQPHHIAHSSIICMVRVLAQSGHIDEALSHFKSLRAQFPSLPPSLPLYNLLLRSTLQHNRPDLVTCLYTDMIAARVAPQTYTFNLLIQSLCESRAFDHALQLFDKMPEKGCHPNEFTLGILVRGLCRAGLARQASELVNNNNLCRNGNRVVYNTLVSRFCREEMNDEAEKLVERMSEQGVMPDVVTFNSRISALCRAGKVLEASRIFRDMQMDEELGLPRPNVITFNLMLKGFCKHGMMEDARGLVDTMKKVGNFVSLESYNIWLLGLLRNGELLEAQLVLDEMAAKGIEPNAYTYNIMMDGLCRNHMLSDARGLMDLMMSNGVYPDTVTYSTLLHGYCSKGKVFEAKSVLREMVRNGCQPNTYTCNTLLHSLWKEGRTLEAEEMLQKMNEKCYQPDTVTCNIVVNGLCRNGELDKAIEIVSEMWTNGPTSLDKGNSFASLINSIANVSNSLPDGITYTTLINGLCKVGRLEEAKKKFIEMLAKNLHPDSVTYDTFIWSFCKQGKISSAFHVLKDMEINGCSKTLQTYNALIWGLGSKKQIFEIYGLMDEMREKGISPDICTYNNIISCLCEGGKAKDAVSLLHEMLDKGISPNMSSFKILIKAFCKSGDFKVACELFDVALSICGHKEALYSLMFNELLAGGQLLEAKELFEASLDRYLTLKNFMYKDLIERLCQDERLADANSLLHKLIDKGYGFNHASFMPVIDGFSKRGNKKQADELAKRMMELALEDRTVDKTYQNRKGVIPGKLHKDGGSDWQDIVNRDGGSGIALKTLKRVQKGWGQGSISSLQSQQNDFLDYYDGIG